MPTFDVQIGYTVAGGRVAANTFQVITSKTLADTALNAATIWSTSIMKRLHSSTVFNNTRVATLDGTGFYNYASNKPGEITGDAFPPQVAFLVRKQFGGRSRGGRWFLPGVGETAAGNDGTLSASTIAAMNVELNSWLTGMVAADMVPLYVQSPAAGGGSWPYLSLSVDSKVSTQRRRLR